MSQDINSFRVLVTGTYKISDAYPNVRYKIDALKNNPHLDVIEIRSTSSTQVNYSSKWSRYCSLLRLAFNQCFKSLGCVATVIKYRNLDGLYIPYPAVPLLFLISFVPKGFKPGRIVADTFISLYDTIVIDRKLLNPSGLIAQAVFGIEKRALRTAALVITDTPENSQYLSALLELPGSSFAALPLSVNESLFTKASERCLPAVGSDSVFRVLFIGTLVPLQRIDTILNAITLLKPQKKFEITIIGDGQQSHLVEAFLNRGCYDIKNVSINWVRQWTSSQDLLAFIQNAHVCLGIMGTDGKSGRVWPFKNYLYMASGKALITAATTVTKRLLASVDYQPFVTVDTADPENLATLLQRCSEDLDGLSGIACNAGHYFKCHLSKEATADRLFLLITGTLRT